MRLSSSQRQCLSNLGIDVWYQKQVVDKTNACLTVSVTLCGTNDDTWLWLSDAVDLTVEQSALLCKIQQAVGVTSTSVTSMTLDDIQQLMPKAVVLLGNAVAQFLPVTVTSGMFASPAFCQHGLVTASLQAMLDNPNCKRDVWRDLQALQAACASAS